MFQKLGLMILVCLISLVDINAKKTTLNSNTSKTVVWEIAKLSGKKQIVQSEFGKSVSFNGNNDAIFLSEMPLKGLSSFTIEAIFKPESGGKFEQRFLHCGETTGSRAMLELRTKGNFWYFDAYLNSYGVKKTLIDSTKLHVLDKWYHVAFVNSNGKISTYINGELELTDSIAFKPFYKGKTSIGVRRNKVSWFKGSIHKISISTVALKPDQFVILLN